MSRWTLALSVSCLFLVASGCAAPDRAGDRRAAEPSPSDESPGVAIRLSGDLDDLSLPADPGGANRMLTATIRGAEPLSVWLAPTAASPARCPECGAAASDEAAQSGGAP